MSHFNLLFRHISGWLYALCPSLLTSLESILQQLIFSPESSIFNHSLWGVWESWHPACYFSWQFTLLVSYPDPSEADFWHLPPLFTHRCYFHSVPKAFHILNNHPGHFLPLALNQPPKHNWPQSIWITYTCVHFESTALNCRNQKYNIRKIEAEGWKGAQTASQRNTKRSRVYITIELWTNVRLHPNLSPGTAWLTEVCHRHVSNTLKSVQSF